MSSNTTSFAAPEVSPKERLDVLFEEAAELTGQRNAIEGRLVDIIAEIDRDGLAGMTGALSIPAMVAWKLGVSPRNAEILTAIAQRREEFPRCTAMLREGRVSLDQVGVIAERAADGSDDHYAQLIPYATVTQIRYAVKLETKPTPSLEPPPQPEPEPEPAPEPEPEPKPVSRPDPPRRQAKRSITQTSDDESVTWHITLPHHEAAEFQAALDSHRDALVADWKRDHTDNPCETTPPFPVPVDGFMSLVRAGWDADVAARPHGHRTTVVVHLDVKDRIAALHLGPLLSDDDRKYLLCDATCEVWFERDGQVIGSGRETRTISRRLRRALEHRDRGTCVVPGCGATRGLHAHHLVHWGTAAPPNCGIWCWSALFTIGRITAGSSPSPVPPPSSSSPMPPGAGSPTHHWPDHPPHPHRMFHRAPGPPGNAPNGGGTTPSTPPATEQPASGPRAVGASRR